MSNTGTRRARGFVVRRRREAWSRTAQPGPGLVIDGDYGPFTLVVVRELGSPNLTVYEDGASRRYCREELLGDELVRAVEGDPHRRADPRAVRHAGRPPRRP